MESTDDHRGLYKFKYKFIEVASYCIAWLYGCLTASKYCKPPSTYIYGIYVYCKRSCI